ncbi:MBL fold metallo-hydrolase [Chryseobacterium arthrosphaerae]|uniref:MBL fold metallo-hydrolase n=1 Tax=Chryseobacterium arthrosphaerae TaxID=651561 RepID=UPI0023E0DD3A|nr:MBL fold metallo-hydrolase [Chryseobacterium arthrosphaerae]WET00145.1 MBL fold metallo-hydrolase [Chryseobacterium arthrosphaerae]
MQIFIRRFENSPVDSNCFLIFNEQKYAIIIDPGTQNHDELYDFIEKENLTIEYCVITHGHFDHVYGIEDIISRYNPICIFSNESLLYIQNSKKNLSIFYGKQFSCNIEKYIAVSEDQYNINWHGQKIEIYSTKGHSDSCISIKINDDVFVGDLMINGEKTVTKLPSGNKTMARQSIHKVLNLDGVETVYGGHGDPMTKIEAENFFLNEN